MKRFARGETKIIVRRFCDGIRNCLDIAVLTGLSASRVQSICRENNFPLQHLPPPRKKKSLENIAIIERIKKVADGALTSRQIAESVGSTAKYVQRVMLAYGLPRLGQIIQIYGKDNPAWVGGRCIDLAGYAVVGSPKDHPCKRKNGSISEHRLVVEQKIGRYLLPSEVVDHLDGITIHNHPDNLQLFASNADHLRETKYGQMPAWSQEGLHKLKQYRQQPNLPVVDKYRQNKEHGDVRLRSILRAWLLLDKDSPYLLGTLHWLEQAGIHDLSRSNLKLHLQQTLLRMA